MDLPSIPRRGSRVLALAALALTFVPNTADAAKPPPPPPVRHTYELTFETQSPQSMWGAGEILGLLNGADGEYELFDFGFSASGGASDIRSKLGMDFGGAVSGSISGSVAMKATLADFSAGKVEVTYPVRVDVFTPAPDSFLAGETVRIPTRWRLEPGAEIRTTSPASGSFKLDAFVDVTASASAEVCLFGCFGVSIPEISLPDGDSDTPGDQPYPVNLLTIVGGGDPSGQPGCPIAAGSLGLPDVVTESHVAPDGETLVATGTGAFGGGGFQMSNLRDLILCHLGVDFLFEESYLDVKWVDLAGNLFIELDQEFTFTPNVSVDFDFDRAVKWQELDLTGAVVASGTSQKVTIAAGHDLAFVVPDDPAQTFNVTPTVWLDGKLHNKTTFRAGGAPAIEVFKAEAAIPSVTIVGNPSPIPDIKSPSVKVSVGPLKTFGIISGTLVDVDLRNGSWDLGGLPKLQQANVLLDQQRVPVAVATGPAALLEGEVGTFSAAGSTDGDGDPLSFSWDFGTGSGSIGETVDYAFPDDGVFYATGKVGDGNGNSDEAAVRVDVTNVPPVATAGTPKQTTEGKPVSLGPVALGTNLVLNGGADDPDDALKHWTTHDGFGVRYYSDVPGTLADQQLVDTQLVRYGGAEDPVPVPYPWSASLPTASYGSAAEDDPGFPIDSQLLKAPSVYGFTTDVGGFEDSQCCGDYCQYSCSVYWTGMGPSLYTPILYNPYGDLTNVAPNGASRYHRPNVYVPNVGYVLDNTGHLAWDLPAEALVYIDAGLVDYTFSGYMMSQKSGHQSYLDVEIQNINGKPKGLFGPDFTLWGPADGSNWWQYRQRHSLMEPGSRKFTIHSRGYGDYTVTDSLRLELHMATGILKFPDQPTGQQTGPKFFYGGTAATTSATQSFDVTPLFGLVDEGLVSLSGSALLGGLSVQRDNAKVEYVFRDGNDAEISRVTVGPLTPEQRGNATGMFQWSADQAVPPFTRKLDVEVTLTRVDGGRNDAYVDNIQAFLHVAPGPDLGAMPANGLLSTSSPGPADRGSRYFAGAFGGPDVHATQDIELPEEIHPLVDAGVLSYDLSAYLGGFADQDDLGIVKAEFYDAAGGWLGQGKIQGPTASERAKTSGVFLRRDVGALPPSTRKVVVTLRSTKANTPRADGFIDSVSLVLDGPSYVGFSDAGVADTHTATVTWGDGTGVLVPQLVQEAGGGAITATHTYADDAPDPYPVELCVEDDDGAEDCAGTTITVANVPPAVAASNLFVVNGQAFDEAVATFADPGVVDTHTARVNWGDGLGFQAATVAGGTVSGGTTYQLAPGAVPTSIPILVEVTDDEGASGYGQALVTVVEQGLPALTAQASPQAIDEGGQTSLSFVIADQLPGGLTYDAEWQLGDGTTVVLPVSGGTAPATPKVYPQDGKYLATVTLRGYSGGTLVAVSTASVVVDVQNVTPDVDAGPDLAATEGAQVALTATWSDPGVQDELAAVISWGDGWIEPASAATPSGSLTAQHAYADEGTYTVEVCVSDDDATGCDSAQVVVTNVGPTLEVDASPKTAAEGTEVALSGTATDAGPKDAVSVTVDWGDDAVEPAGYDASSGAVSGDHVYAAAGSYTIEVCAADDDGASICRTIAVTVTNAAPVVTDAQDTEGVEGSPTSIIAVFADAGLTDVHTATIDWGDGATSSGTVTQGQGGGFVSGDHVYGDDGAYTVTVTVDDGASTGSGTLIASVGNRPPRIDAVTATGAVEGQAATLVAAYSDPGVLDTHTVTVDWGEGGPAGIGTATGGAATATHVYAVAGEYTAAVCVTDDEGAQACADVTVSVADAPPSVAGLADQAVAEGDAVDLGTISVTDPSAPGPVTLIIDYGEGADPVEVPAMMSAAPGGGSAAQLASPAYAYANEGTYDVTVCAEDEAGNQGCTGLAVVVSNAPPTVYAGPDRVVAEGSAVDFPLEIPDFEAGGGEVPPIVYGADDPRPFAFSDPGTLDVHTATIDWGDGTSEAVAADDVFQLPSGPPGDPAGQGGSVGASHVYADDGTYVVTVCVDDGLAEACDDLSVSVTNVDPVVSAAATGAGVQFEPLALPPGIFEDPGFDFAPAGTVETFSATVDWGAGDGPQALPAGAVTWTPGSSGTASTGVVTLPSHVYTGFGPFTVTVCVDDDDDGHGCASTAVEIEPAPLEIVSLTATPGPEGAESTLAATLDNQAASAVTAVWEFPALPWCDAVAQVAAGQVTIDIATSCVAGDDGAFAAALTVTDAFGRTDSASTIVSVTNVAPVAALVTDGAVALPGGSAVFLAVAGEPTAFAAEAFDQGSDDATFLWSFAPDEATVAETVFNDGQGPDAAASPGGVYPFDAASSAEHAFSGPGVYAVRAEVSDDDGGVSADEVTAIATGDGTCPMRPGEWQAQLTGCKPGKWGKWGKWGGWWKWWSWKDDCKDWNKWGGGWGWGWGSGKSWYLDPALLDAYLQVADLGSGVFSEEVPVSSAEDAIAVLDPGKAKGLKAKLKTWIRSELLAAWLNFAHGAIGWEDEVTIYGFGAPETMTFGQIVEAVEATVLDDDASKWALLDAWHMAKAARRPTPGCKGWKDEDGWKGGDDWNDGGK